MRMDVTKERQVNWILLWVIQVGCAYFVYTIGYDFFVVSKRLDASIIGYIVSVPFAIAAFFNAISVIMISSKWRKLLVVLLLTVLLLLLVFMFSSRGNEGIVKLYVISMLWGFLSANIYDELMESIYNKKHQAH